MFFSEIFHQINFAYITIMISAFRQITLRIESNEHKKEMVYDLNHYSFLL